MIKAIILTISMAILILLASPLTASAVEIIGGYSYGG